MNQDTFERLKRYCTTQAQIDRLTNVFQLGSQRKAAKHEGVNKNAVAQTIKVLTRRAALAGESPEADASGLAPEGFVVQGKSTMYDDQGNIKLQWVKTKQSLVERHEKLLEALEEASDRIGAIALPRSSGPKECDSQLLAVYPYGDPHIGMYAWHGDAQADFDLDRAVQIMTSATQRLVKSAPPAQKALVAFLGDFYHADNQNNVTTRSGHQLDVDSRWSKVFQTGVETAAVLIKMALAKHKEVHVICEIGNHDDHSALALAVCLSMYFRNEPRVTVDTSAQRFHYYRFGQNLIGIHHGDLVKPAALPGLMAADRSTDWGKTTHRVWYTGHIHNQTRYDLAGCEVESFRILPPRDAWAQSMGYRGGASMDCIVRHKERGEIGRQTVHATEL